MKYKLVTDWTHTLENLNEEVRYGWELVYVTYLEERKAFAFLLSRRED